MIVKTYQFYLQLQKIPERAPLRLEKNAKNIKKVERGSLGGMKNVWKKVAQCRRK